MVVVRYVLCTSKAQLRTHSRPSPTHTRLLSFHAGSSQYVGIPRPGLAPSQQLASYDRDWTSMRIEERELMIHGR